LILPPGTSSKVKRAAEQVWLTIISRGATNKCRKFFIIVFLLALFIAKYMPI
jgi:hypothetical protein